MVGGGVFRCCVPWCGARAAAPTDDDAEYEHALRDGSPHLSLDEYSKYKVILYILLYI